MRREIKAAMMVLPAEHKILNIRKWGSQRASVRTGDCVEPGAGAEARLIRRNCVEA